MDHSEVKHLPKVDHTPAEFDAVAKRLLDAAALIEKHGLSKWTCCDTEGRLCLRGALVVAGGQLRNHRETNWWTADAISREADDRVRKSLGDESDKGDSSPDWNNAEERTKDEVVAKLRAVALGG